MRIHSKVQARRGTAIVEAAILLPLVLLLLLGVWELGRMAEVTQILNNAAREGARAASTGQNSYAQVKTIVVNYLNAAGVTDQSGLRVDIANLTANDNGPGTDGTVGTTKVSDYDPSQASQLDKLQVTVSLPLDNFRWNTPRLISNAASQVSGQAVWPSGVNQHYPTTVTPPNGY